MTVMPVIRRVVLWRWRDAASPEQKLGAKEGLAYISFASRVDGVDFGEDLGHVAGGYDLALVRDHRDKDSWDAYNEDPHHERVGSFIDTLTHEDLTARADYLYGGVPSIPGRIRDVTLYVWRAGADEGRRAEVRRALLGLRADCRSIAALEVADDLGWAGQGRADLVVEAHFEDVERVREFLDHPAQREVAAMLASVTDTDRTARVQHRMLSG